MSRIMNRIKTAMWAFKIAWKIDSVMICVWLSISIGLSVLPAISLYFNKNIINALTDFINFGSGTYQEIMPQIIIFGIILTFIGFTSRLSGEFIYIMMYNSYYVGMQEILMESVQEIDMIDLMNGKLNDEYSFAVGRAGSLTDFISGFCSLVGKMVSIVSLLVVAVTTSKIIFIFALVYIICIIAFYLLFADKIRFDAQKIFGDARKADYFASLPRDVNIAKEIRIYENTEDIIKQWDTANKVVEKNELKRKGAVELHNFIGEISFYVFIMLTIAFMLIILAQGKLNITTFLVIYTLAFNIQKAISGLSREMYNCDYGMFALEKQRQFFIHIKKEKKKNCIQIQEKPSITYQLENVSFSYLDGVPVLKNINLQIKKGDVVALVGENGSGKSTLANLLLNLYKPTAGTIKLYEVDLQQYTKDEVRKVISPFFQDFYIFHDKVYNNIAFGDINSYDDQQKIQDAIVKGGADSAIKKLPYGLDTFLGKIIEEKGIQLSGGENQKIAVARAHMSNREIMIFDEPAAALDPIAEMNQFMNIRNKLKGRTAILISHRVGFARMADQIIMMANGEIVETGKHDDLMNANGAYAKFFNSQAEWYK